MRRFASIASGLFACVTGCGDDGVHHLADAPPPDDTGIDAPASGTANITTNVRCCTVVAGTPQAGVRIVVVRRDHSVGAMAMTDAQGKASVAVQTGDSVTAIYPEDADDSTDLTTILGVKPGDNLTFGEANYVVGAAGTTGQINLSWPPVANAYYHYIYTPCGYYYAGGSDVSTTIDVYPYCQTPTAPIVFVAYNSNGAIIASSYLPAAPFTPGTLPPITWTALAAPNYALSVSGLDAAVDRVYFRASGAYPGQLEVTTGETSDITAGGATSNLTVPASAARTYGSMELERNGTNGRQRYFQAQATAVAFTSPMPWLNGAAYSPGDGQAVWLQTAGTYDAATIRFDWYRDDSKQSHYFNWNLIIPPGTTALDLGKPPVELAPYLPTSTDNVDAELVLIDLASAASYDDLRSVPESTVMDPEGAIRSGTITGVGMSGYDGGEGFSFAANH
jgi:hypothetical protein